MAEEGNFPQCWFCLKGCETACFPLWLQDRHRHTPESKDYLPDDSVHLAASTNTGLLAHSTVNSKHSLFHLFSSFWQHWGSYPGKLYHRATFPSPFNFLFFVLIQAFTNAAQLWLKLASFLSQPPAVLGWQLCAPVSSYSFLSSLLRSLSTLEFRSLNSSFLLTVITGRRYRASIMQIP